MAALFSRWYAFGPWLLMVLVVWRQCGWRRALALAAGGWLIAFLAEWSSTAGPGIPFGHYSYRAAGLDHDWRLLGVPVFDSLSFTWLACCGYFLAGWLGARAVVRWLLAGLAMVAIDVVVDPVALRGGRWWLGSIYSYPHGQGVWYGVSAWNYVGWLVVGLALSLLVWLCLGESGGRARLGRWISALLVAGVMVQGTVLAALLGIWPSALLALALLLGLGALARLSRSAEGPVPEPSLVVACALGSEAAAARRALGPEWRRVPVPGFRRWSAPGRPGLEVWETGLGSSAAARAAGRLAPATAVLVAGVGGACSAGWEIGEVGVATRVLDPDGHWWPLGQEPSRELEARGLGRPASLASWETGADSPGTRARLAGLGVDVAEMETAAWLRSRPEGAGTRLVALRAVVDTPEAPLGVASDLIGPGQASPSPGRLARLLLAHPGSLGQLLAVAGRQRRALAAMAAAIPEAVLILDLTKGNHNVDLTPTRRLPDGPPSGPY